jgi:16S rRNA (guanine527-N7)-methyltransferase
VFHVKQPAGGEANAYARAALHMTPAEQSLLKYRSLIERYHDTLDLMSARGLMALDRLMSEAQRYAELVASLSPTAHSILDLGSGAGLPGIPIALTLPRAAVTLVERRRRRVSFLRIAVSQLGLLNVTVVGDDVRGIREPCVDVITAQAVGTLVDVHVLTRHLQRERVWLVSRKGPGWREELGELEAELGRSALEVREEQLGQHGTLVAVLLPGGSVCPPSG